MAEQPVGSEDPVERAWGGGLIRSTSQTVFDILTAISNAPSAYKNRWLWELFQNAIDASDGNPLEMKISLDSDQLTFSHTGTPFKVEEAVQLILKGSTKRTLSGKLGRFGTGFITTHFISKVVDVEGMLEEAPGFKFKLDRTSSNPDELGKKMAAAKEELKLTMKTHHFADKPYTTRFSYQLQSSESKRLAEESLNEIGTFLPFVLALNPEIAKVVVENGRGPKQEWRRSSETRLASGPTLVEISTGNQKDDVWVAVMSENGVSVSVGLRKVNGKLGVAELGAVPKLFAAFPLIGTESFPIPALLNSREFEPTDDRDGVWLRDAESPEVQKNRPLVSQGVSLIASLVKTACAESWQDLHRLSLVSEVPATEWVDAEWLTSKAKWLVEQLESLPLVETEGGKQVTPAESLIPFSDEDNTRTRIWDIASKLLTDQIPKKELQATWAAYIKKSAAIKDVDPTSLLQCLTLSKLASRFESTSNMEKLGESIPKGGNATTIVEQMLKLVYEKGKDLFDNYTLVPNQKGTFRKRSELRRDDGVDEGLKDIALKFGMDIRSRLQSLSLLEEVQKLSTAYTEEDLINEIKPLLRSPSQPPSDSYKESNPQFLEWAIQRQRFDLVEGFPVITIRSTSVKTSNQVVLSSKQPLLAPPSQWDKQYATFSSLFPDDGMMSSTYDSAVSKESWEKLSENNFVMTSPLQTTTTGLDKEQIETLLSGGEFDASKEHRASAPVTTLAFLQSEGGVMDIVRGNQDRAVEFLDFLLNVLITVDHSWEDSIECKCDCQAIHTIYPSMWLYVVRRRIWVPFPSKARRPAEAESIARMFEARPTLQPKLLDDLTSMFFSRLKVSITDILKHIGTTSEQARLDLEKALVGVFLASGKSVAELNTLAEVWRNTEYRSEIEKMMKQRELVKKNQEIGRVMEQLIQTVCNGSGIGLVKIHRGGDFVNENDFVDTEGQVVLKAGELTIEVKTTTTDSVKMTPAQAEESVLQNPNYFLCVVQLPTAQADQETVRLKARFVPKIGDKLKSLVSTYHHVQLEESKALLPTGDVQLSIQGTVVRFHVSEQVWRNALTIDGFKELITKMPAAHSPPPAA